jgi:hypothetical protein
MTGLVCLTHVGSGVLKTAHVIEMDSEDGHKTRLAMFRSQSCINITLREANKKRDQLMWGSRQIWSRCE